MAGPVAPGCEISRERTARHVARHHHLAPYAAIVLRGGYVEAGDRGRFRAEAGAVLIHDGFEAHQDQFESSGADILNLPLRYVPAIVCGRLADPEAIVRLAERDRDEAAAALVERLVAVDIALDDWPDLLAADLCGADVPGLRAWAASRGLTPSSVSRGFRLCYGVSPQRYRLEQKARRAAQTVRRRSESLAQIAAQAGFADQAHMSRAMRRCYGKTPSALRQA